MPTSIWVKSRNQPANKQAYYIAQKAAQVSDRNI